MTKKIRPQHAGFAKTALNVVEQFIGGPLVEQKTIKEPPYVKPPAKSKKDRRHPRPH